jgi:hypothetical protein
MCSNSLDLSNTDVYAPLRYAASPFVLSCLHKLATYSAGFGNWYGRKIREEDEYNSWAQLSVRVACNLDQDYYVSDVPNRFRV